MNIKIENNNYQNNKILNETSFLMPTSTLSTTTTVTAADTNKQMLNTNNTITTTNTTCTPGRPIITTTSHIKPTIIHHFQIKKSQSFNKPVKIENSLNEKTNIEIKIQELNPFTSSKGYQITGSPKSIDSRSNVTTAKNANHVQFVLPVTSSLTQQLANGAQLVSVQAPSNTGATSSSSSLNNNMSNNNSKPNEFLGATTTLKVNNRIQSTLPLKNITTIRSSSFRNRNLSKQDTNSTLTSVLTGTNNGSLAATSTTNTSRTNQLNETITKTKNSRSFENINVIKVDEQTQPSIHRLIKMASSWNGSKSRADSSASNNYFKYPKVNESSLISQSKIRQTQMFLNDENKCVNSCESVLSRKIGDYDKRLHHRSSGDDDDNTSDKLNTNRSRTPVRILPITSRNTYVGASSGGGNHFTENFSKKSSLTESNEGNLVNTNMNTNTIWSHHTHATNSASEISDGSAASVKDSSITNYLHRKNKTFNLVQLNRNLNALKLNQSTTTNTSNQLNQVNQMPIQIQ